MDQFIGFILLIIAISVIDRVMKAFKAGKRMPMPPVDAESEEEPLFLERDVEVEQLEGGEGRLDSDLERLIAEELGLRPKRRQPAEPRTAPRDPPRRLRPSGEGEGGGGTLQRSAPSRPPPVPVGPRRTVVLPTPRPELETGVGRERVPRPIERRVPRRPRTAVEEVELAAPAPARASAKRRPVRRAVAARVRHQGPARLPDFPGWTQVQKAIVWAEIIGPPRGLSE